MLLEWSSQGAAMLFFSSSDIYWCDFSIFLMEAAKIEVHRSVQLSYCQKYDATNYFYGTAWTQDLPMSLSPRLGQNLTQKCTITLGRWCFKSIISVAITPCVKWWRCSPGSLGVLQAVFANWKTWGKTWEKTWMHCKFECEGLFGLKDHQLPN